MHPIIARILTLMIGMLLVSLFIVAQNIYVSAAPSEPEPCVHVATAGTVKVYRCMDEQEGTLFYVNNIGFMLLGE